MSNEEKLKEALQALEWMIAEMSIMGYGTLGSVKEAKNAVRRIKEE